MEDGLPSLPVNETLFDDANWAQDIPLPDNEEMDVFSLVETLGLDEDMALHDVDSLWPVQQGQHQVHDAQEHQPECQKPVAKRGGQKSKEAQRVERIRARNREAQARYRQKARGQAAELECSISTIQSAVTSARERQQNLQDQKTLLQQRCSNSSAALDAIRSVSNLIPATPAVPSHTTAGCPETAPGRIRKEPTCAPVEAISPPVASASTSAGTSLISTKPKRRPTDSIFSPQPVSSIPRPLSSYVHHKSIALSEVGSSAAGQLSRASLHPSELWDEQELAVTGKLEVRKCVDDFRTAEARSCGCDVSDISWYIQTHVDLGTNLAKAPSSVVGQDPATTEDIASQLSTCGLDEESSSTDTVFYSKRRRDGTGGSISMSGQSRKAHKSTGEVLASLGLTYKHFDLCNVRCGKDAVLPLRQAVENAFSSTVVRLCGVMPLSLLRRCFEQAIDTIDRMLIGFTKGLRSCPTSSQATPSHSGISDDSHQASMNGAGTHADTDAQGAGATFHCPCGTFEASKQPSSWEELYTQETNLHAICTMLAVRHQLTAFIDDMLSIVAGSNPTDRLTTRPQLVHHIRQLAEEFCFSEIVSTMDSPKLVFNMIMDAFQPFLGQYYLMDNMHVNLYRKVRPSALQRSLMAEFWLAQANRRRSHDEYIHTARSLLAALPSNVPLPLDFFTHLNNLLASGTPSEGAHSIVISPAGPVPGSLAKQLSSVFSRSPITSQAAQNLESCFQRSSNLSMNGKSSALSWNMDNDPTHHQQHSIDSRQYSVLSLSHNSSSVGMSQIPSDQPEVRFMGQHAEDMVRAEMALRELHTVQDAARDLQADVLNADMPGVLLQVDKQTRIWADHFMSQMMPPDFLELCQMAASQQNRFSLFEHPFK